jgi:hypothetical protein
VNRTLTLTFFLSFFLSLKSFAAAGPFAECSFYSEKSEELGCDENNYLTRFGAKYCNLFLEKEAIFSELGKIFLPQIRDCLIQQLKIRDDLTCENVQRRGISSHVQCFVEHGYCRMPFSDRFKIYMLARKDFAKYRLFSTAFRIDFLCRQRRDFRPVPEPFDSN